MTWALCHRTTELKVGARQYNLKEVGVSQLPVLIRVEEFHDIVAVGLSAIRDPILSQEVEQIHWSQETIFVPVEPLKAGVAVKGLVGAEELAKDLELLFSFGNT